jgi:hypothetical protein
MTPGFDGRERERERAPEALTFPRSTVRKKGALRGHVATPTRDPKRGPMAPSPCEREIPELRAPWSGLSAAIRCCWTSAHEQVEIRAVTISGAPVFDKHVAIKNGEDIQLHEALVPYGCAVSWSVVVFVSDVTDTRLEGLSVLAEFIDADGRGVRRSICKEATIAANKAVQIAYTVDAPERDHA